MQNRSNGCRLTYFWCNFFLDPLHRCDRYRHPDPDRPFGNPDFHSTEMYAIPMPIRSGLARPRWRKRRERTHYHSVTSGDLETALIRLPRGRRYALKRMGHARPAGDEPKPSSPSTSRPQKPQVSLVSGHPGPLFEKPPGGPRHAGPRPHVRSRADQNLRQDINARAPPGGTVYVTP